MTCSTISTLTYLNVLIVIIITVFEIVILKLVGNPDALNRVSENFKTPCSLVDEGGRASSLDREIAFMKYVDENGKLTCSIHSNQDLAFAVEMLLKLKLRIEKSKGGLLANKYTYYTRSADGRHIVPGKPVAHLIHKINLNRHTVRRNGSEHHDLQDWTARFSPAFTQNGVAYHSGRLKIPYDGLYYLYSQVSFLQPNAHAWNTSGESNVTEPRTHSMYAHTTTGGPKLLMQSYCNNFVMEGPQSLQQTSYLGGMTRLKKNDEISVRVSNLRQVASNRRSTYFGLYLI